MATVKPRAIVRQRGVGALWQDLVAASRLEALISAGRGDLPLRFRCTNCRGRLTDFVVMAKDSHVQPW